MSIMSLSIHCFCCVFFFNKLHLQSKLVNHVFVHTHSHLSNILVIVYITIIITTCNHNVCSIVIHEQFHLTNYIICYHMNFIFIEIRQIICMICIIARRTKSDKTGQKKWLQVFLVTFSDIQ